MSNLVTTQASSLALAFGIDASAPQQLVDVLKATAFKGSVTDAQLTALLIVANQYHLNPWTKEIYAFPDKNNGIVPVVGVDGWSRIINSDPNFDGMEFVEDPEWTECIIYRKDRSHPIRVREYMAECKRDIAGPWKSHPRRMLRHKAMIQCSRLAFGFVGIYDPDEADRIIEGEFAVRGSSQRPGIQAAELVAPVDSPERDLLIADMLAVADMGSASLKESWERIGRDKRLLLGDKLEDFKARAALADAAAATTGEPA